MIKDKISIILPTYNSENSLKEAIESILNQTITNFELIIVNDGSTDNTDKLCKKYANKNNKIKYFHINQSGVSNARNYALTKVTGEYITFIDSDDKYKENYLEILLKNLKESKSDLVTCSYQTLSNNPKIINYKENLYKINIKEYIETLQPRLLTNQLWNKIYKTKIIKDNNIKFDTKIDLGEDYKFNLEYITKSKDLTYITESLYQYRITDNGLGFKYRTNSNQIKLSLLNILEDIYLKRNYDIKYINKSYLIQYISYFSNIVDKRNKIPTQEKIITINNIITSKNYKEKITQIRKTSNLKYKIICNIFLIKNKYFIYYLGLLANKYDKYKKQKTYK